MQFLDQINICNNDITIIDAKPQQEELYRNLVNLQFHDLSEFRNNFDILEDGRFVWNFPGCFAPDNQYHHPLLILFENKIVGFLIFSDFKGKHQEVDFQLVEMFVLKMYRRKGIGKNAIEMIFDKYKGKYHLDVAENNIPALKFWKKYYQKTLIKLLKNPL